MAYTLKEGQGSLFKNEKQNDRQPDYKGTIVIGDTTYEIAAWERTSKSGMSYLSLQASLPRERTEQQPQQPVYQAPTPQPQYTEEFPVASEYEDLPF